MQNVYLTLRITDYDAAKAFYVDALGFRIDWDHRFAPGLPMFIHLSRDDLALYLSQHRGAGQVGELVSLCARRRCLVPRFPREGRAHPRSAR
jgi:catechol 2,3-dioxygenase-like lactoylglutathione lyase family enzyme